MHEGWTEETLWDVVVAHQGTTFYTASGLPFSYRLKKGRSGLYTRELWVDRRERSKSLSWSSVRLALERLKPGRVYDRPKAIGDIRGVSYIYGLFWRFGLIEVPPEVAARMPRAPKEDVHDGTPLL